MMVGETSSCGKTVVLDRPHALNALDTTMGIQLIELYKSWENDPKVGFIVLKGNGRAFCAGGDVVNVYNKIIEGKSEDSKFYFKVLYTLIHLISSYPKPHVAILNGITMGAGSGISVLGTFRVATDKTVYAIPETLIGFHPDAAASYYISRLPGHLGEYLALTADKLNGAEMFACGLATHYSHSTKIPLIEEQLSRTDSNDPKTIRAILDYYGETPRVDDHCILNKMDIIDQCFGCDNVEDIFTALESNSSGVNYEWCTSTLNHLKTLSPLSLKVSLKSIREGRNQTLEQCLAREYRMTAQAIHGHISKDFHEGVRTRLVDKSLAPKWDPSSLDQVSENMVNQYFTLPSKSESSLDLPINRNPSPIRLFNDHDDVMGEASRNEATKAPNLRLEKHENNPSNKSNKFSYVKAKL
ncbi:hypothetical protein vseg_002579 [Gypsophila vaccaria]